MDETIYKKLLGYLSQHNIIVGKYDKNDNQLEVLDIPKDEYTQLERFCHNNNPEICCTRQIRETPPLPNDRESYHRLYWGEMRYYIKKGG